MREARPARDNPFVPMSSTQRTIVFAAFAVYLVTVAIARRYDPTPTEDWILLWLTVYVGMLALPLAFLRQLGWFHPLVFSSLFAVVGLLRRIGVYAWGLDWHRALPMSAAELSELVELQLILQSAALAAQYVGFVFGPRIPVPRIGFAAPRSLATRLLAVCALGVVAFLAFITSQGGLEAHIASWGSGRVEGLGGKHYFIALATLGIPACLVWLAYQPSALRSPWFLACAGSALAIAFLASGSRGSALYAAATGFCVWMLRRRQLPYLRVLLAIVVAIYVLTVLGSFRRSTWQGAADWEAATREGLVDTVVQGARGELVQRGSVDDGMLPILARVPHDVPFLAGDSYLAVISLPIPKALWPGKPGMIDGRVGRTFFDLNAGVPPGAIGEAYWNFHVPGVLVVFFLYGVFLQWLGRTYRAHADAPGMAVVLAATVFLFREPSGPAFVLWMLMLVPVVFVLFWAGALRLPAGGRLS